MRLETYRPMRKGALVLLLTGLLAGPAAAEYIPGFTITPLKDFGFNDSEVRDINNYGFSVGDSIAGTAFDAEQQAVFWYPAGNVTVLDFDPYPRVDYQIARAINDAGLMVGRTDNKGSVVWIDQISTQLPNAGGVFLARGFQAQIPDQHLGSLKLFVQHPDQAQRHLRVLPQHPQHAVVSDETHLHRRQGFGCVRIGAIVKGLETDKMPRDPKTEDLLPAVGQRSGQLDLSFSEQKKVISRILFTKKYLVRQVTELRYHPLDLANLFDPECGEQVRLAQDALADLAAAG